MRAPGADFSSNQSVAVTRELAPQLRFAFVKLTEGTGYVSPTWREQFDTLRQHGVWVGAYHFGQPGDGARQWDYFEAQLQHRPIDLVAFDYEAAGVTDRTAREFIRRGRQRGYKVGLYGSSGVARRRLGQAWTWAAWWNPKPPPFRWDIWQTAAGANGKPDWDVFNGDVGQLGAFLMRTSRKTAKPPLRWWIHDANAQRAFGPYRLPRLAAALVVYLGRHPRVQRIELERK